jgi:hypothetical protein
MSLDELAALDLDLHFFVDMNFQTDRTCRRLRPGLVAVGCICSPSWTPVVWTSVDGIVWTPIPDDDAVLGLGDRMYGASIQGPDLVAVGTDRSGDAVVWIATLED